MILVAFAIAFVISAVIVNAGYNLFMNFIGADSMFFSAKTKLIIMVVVALLLLAPFNSLFS